MESQIRLRAEQVYGCFSVGLGCGAIQSTYALGDLLANRHREFQHVALGLNEQILLQLVDSGGGLFQGSDQVALLVLEPFGGFVEGFLSTGSLTCGLTLTVALLECGPGDLRELGVLAVYLASPASDYMTGQGVVMDGGRTAR